MYELLVFAVLSTGLKGIFGVPIGFVLGFFLKLALLFAISAIISKLIHIERAFNNNHDYETHKNK
jgi:hypothetical protein